MPPPYVITIPSRGRPKEIREKTLSALHSNNIPSTRIHIVVHSQREAKEYTDAIPRMLYGSLLVSSARDGLRGQLNFIFK